jgi:hypothetical protein
VVECLPFKEKVLVQVQVLSKKNNNINPLSLQIKLQIKAEENGRQDIIPNIKLYNNLSHKYILNIN